MRTFSKLTGGIAIAALIASSATPAAARGWDWNGRGHHRDRGPDAGTVIGAIAAVGILAAIVSAASSKKRQADDRRYDAEPPYAGPDDNGYYDNGAPRPSPGDEGARYENRGSQPRADESRSTPSREDAAVDACAIAARDRAGEGSSYAEVRGVTAVTPKGSGWDVTGEIEQRSSYRANDGASRSFRCSWQDGRVSAVSLD